MHRVKPAESRYFPPLLVLTIALSFIVCGPTPPVKAAISQTAFEACLLDGVNAARAVAGRAPVQMAYDLVPAVREWSESMSISGFAHMPSAIRLAILPDNWTTWAENIAWHGDENLPNCDAMHEMWMNSPGHLANILNPAMKFVAIGTYVDSSGWWGTQLFFDASDYQPTCGLTCDDEIFFYRADGLFRYYDISPTASLGSPINAGSKYTTDWTAITSVDLDGDGQDEMFFYRDDGLFRYYDVRSGGALGSPLQEGSNYTTGWDSITAVDLDGDGQDEMFFYREDGLYRFYNADSDGSLGSPILAGSNYTTGWDSITAVDLDGDGQDEMFFYRNDGLYRFYDINTIGSLGTPILAGSNYTEGWTSITALDIDGDGQDEMFFYRGDGLYRYYNINSSGSLGTPILAGSNYTEGWDAITAVSLD